MDINILLCRPTTDVICILIANPIAKAWASVKSAFAAPQLALATA